MLDFIKNIAKTPTKTKLIDSLILGFLTISGLYVLNFTWPIVISFGIGITFSTYSLHNRLRHWFNKKYLTEAQIKLHSDNLISECEKIAPNLLIIRELILQGADLNAVNEDNLTPLHIAAERNNTEVITLLLDSLSEKSRQAYLAQHGKHAVTLASKHQHDETLEILKNYGLTLEHLQYNKSLIKELKKETPNLFIIQNLISQGVDVNASDKYDNSLLHLAAKKGLTSVVRTLLVHGAHVNALNTDKRNTPLHEAARHGHTDIVSALLAHKAKVNVANFSSLKIPLHKAARYADINTVNVLLTNNADLVNTQDEYYNTPLHIAAQRGRADIAAALLEKGADVNAIDADGETPLHLAATFNHTEVIDVLLNNGANINAINNANDTPLDDAIAHEESIIHLLDSLSEENRRACLNRHGRNLITLAFELGYPNTVATLEAYGVALPEYLQNNNPGMIVNENQSTHAVSVHVSVSQSVLALASCYLPSLSDEEKQQLKAWFDSPLDLDNLSRQALQKTAVDLLQQLLNRDDVKQYITQKEAQLKAFGNNLSQSDVQFTEHHGLKIRAAQTIIQRITSEADYHNFCDGRSSVPMILAMGLVYDGVMDNHNPNLATLTLQERNKILAQAFYEMQRGYNLNDEGHEDDPTADDIPICLNGHFNKILSALAGGRHNAVNVIFVSKRTALLKVQALIKQLYNEHISVKTHDQYIEHIKENFLLPAPLWEEHLKTPVIIELMKEYQSFIDAGMIMQKEIDTGISDAIQVLPSYVFKEIFKQETIKEAKFSEEEKKTIEDRLGLITPSKPAP